MATICNNSMTTTINMDPNMAPSMPAPPMRITPTNHSDKNQGKCSGLRAAQLHTQNAPARPPMNPATKKLRSLYHRILIPRVSAAISLSLIAIHALPILLL